MSCQCSRSGTIHPAVGRLSIETRRPGCFSIEATLLTCLPAPGG